MQQTFNCFIFFTFPFDPPSIWILWIIIGFIYPNASSAQKHTRTRTLIRSIDAGFIFHMKFVLFVTAKSVIHFLENIYFSFDIRRCRRCRRRRRRRLDTNMQHTTVNSHTIYCDCACTCVCVWATKCVHKLMALHFYYNQDTFIYFH